MPRSTRPDAAKRHDVTARRQRAIELRNSGATWQEVADACGYDSRGSACRDITRAFSQEQRRTGESLAELREIESAKLDDLEEVVWGVLAANHVVVQHGKIVYLDDKPLDDLGPILSAVDRLVKISQRRAALHGVDSPVKVESTGKLTYEIVGVDMSQMK